MMLFTIHGILNYDSLLQNCQKNQWMHVRPLPGDAHMAQHKMC